MNKTGYNTHNFIDIPEAANVLCCERSELMEVAARFSQFSEWEGYKCFMDNTKGTWHMGL